MADDFIKGGDMPDDGFIRGNGGETGGIAEDYMENIKRTTREGGLKELPEKIVRWWKNIDSDNPFEILYLDYTQVNSITPEMVKGNYDLLAAFWQKNYLALASGSREKFKQTYGEDRINGAVKKLQDAYNKLKSREGINLYFDEINGKRIKSGIDNIQGLVDVALADGELTPNKADKLIAAGVENGLSNAEVRNFLLGILKTEAFEIRSKPQKEDLLKNIWRQRGKKDPVLNTVSWLGTEVSSLEEMGRVSFDNMETAYSRFRNINFLPQAVMALTRDDSKAAYYERIIEETPNEDLRYLRIVYNLNRELPFRFRGALFYSIQNLLDEAAKDAEGFWKADELFRKGHLQTWIKETDAVTAIKLKDLGNTTSDFLAFIYQIKNSYPFYLGQLRVDSPVALGKALAQDFSLWSLATSNIQNRNIPTWFATIGENNLIDRYNQLFEPVVQAGWYTDQDRSVAATQTLVQTLSKDMPAPRVGFDQPSIQLLSVEGAANVSHNISITLGSPGFTSVFLQLNPAVEGISLSTQKITLNSYNQQSRVDFQLNIDVFRLTKNKIYQLSIIAVTPYEQIHIPVQVRIVFPTANFIKKAAIYGVGAGLFWGLGRTAVVNIVGTNGVLISFGDRLMWWLLAIVLLFISLKILSGALKKEFGKNAKIPDAAINTLWIVAYFLGPVLLQHAGDWFLYWLFPGAALGTYVAQKKYNLNKWLVLIPISVTLLVGYWLRSF